MYGDGARTGGSDGAGRKKNSFTGCCDREGMRRTYRQVGERVLRGGLKEW